MLSVVVPTLNAAAALGSTLESVSRGNGQIPLEVIVADGGSVDSTALISEQNDAIFIEATRGRGSQLAAGATVAAGDWLLFLHADTRLSDNWATVVWDFISEPANRDRAGYFRFALDDTARAARGLEWLVTIRCRTLGLPYGDQGLLISRDHYDALGGYRRIDLMEDVDFVGRIGRRNLKQLPSRAITSPERYRRDGYLIRPLCNMFCLGLYTVGVSPRFISALYR